MIKIMNTVTGVCIIVHVCGMSRTVVCSYKKDANILLCMHYNTGRQKKNNKKKNRLEIVFQLLTLGPTISQA